MPKSVHPYFLVFRITKLYLTFVWVVLFSIEAVPQIPGTRFINYSTQQGLPDKFVRCFVKDKQGYLWIGTRNGLSRFDGVRFKNYYYNPNDSNSLSGNDIYSLFCDSKGFIWISTAENGLNRFNPKLEKFDRFYYDENNKNSIGGNNPRSVIEDDSGKIWVCLFGNGINSFDEKTNSFHRFLFDDQILRAYNFNECINVKIDSKKIFWISTRVGLVRFNPMKNEFSHIKVNLKDKKLHIINQIYIDQKDKIWVCTYMSGVLQFDPDNNLWQQFKVEEQSNIYVNSFNSLEYCSSTELYVTSVGGGFGIFNTSTGKFSFYRNIPSNAYSFPVNSNASCVLYAGTEIFIGSEYGMSTITPASNMFRFYMLDVKGQENDSYLMISAIIPQLQDSTVFFGTFYKSGITEWHLNNGIKKQYNSFGIDYREHVYCIKPDPGNKSGYFVATINGVVYFNIREKKMMPPPMFPTELKSKLKNKLISDLYINKKNQLWIGANSLLIRFDLTTGSYTDYSTLLKDLMKGQSHKFFSVMEDDKGMVWITTSPNNIITLDTTIPKMKFWQEAGKGSSKIPGQPRQVLQDSKGNYWFGLYGAGVASYNRETNNLSILSKQGGLSGVSFNSMFENSDGKIWTNNENGISVIDPDDFSISNYTEKNGYPVDHDVIMHQQSDGNIILTTHDAISFFKPEDLPKSNNPLSVDLISFKVFDKEYKMDTAINFVSDIELSYLQNYFSFEFTTPDFFNPEQISYSYKMDGVDENWINAGGRNFVGYTNLGGGTYTFRLKARNANESWSKNEKTIRIRIIPPFWKTYWFITIAGAVTTAFLLMIFLLRIRSIQKREQAKSEYIKRISELEMTALRAQMNPHFIFNCLNSINRYILKSDPDTASNYVTKFSRLIRLILDNSRLNVVNLSNEMDALKLYLEMEAMRFDNKFEYTIEINSAVDAIKTMVPPMIFQPYVENAIWHGLMHKQEKGNIDIKVYREDEFLICVIDDDGVGRKNAKMLESKFSMKNKSHGLMVTAKRLSIYNQQEKMNDAVTIIDKVNDKGEASGTTVVLKIFIREN